ncbi:MAG TPA: hypothetical protein V6C88_21125 [Chroococcidiopsis sp.]
MNTKQSFIEVPFPMRAFLAQLLFCRIESVVWSPSQFWTAYRIQLLEKCWQQDQQETIKFLEQCWHNS